MPLSVINSYSNSDNLVNSVTVAAALASGSNKLIVAGVNFEVGAAITQVSTLLWNGVSLSPIATRGTGVGDERCELWGLIAPFADGNSHNLVCTFDGTLAFAGTVGLVYFNGAHQSSPYGTAVGAGVTNSQTPSVTVSCAIDDIIIDCLTVNSTSAVADASQAERWNILNGGNTTGAGSTELATSTSVVMSWTLGAVDDWNILAVPIKPAIDFLTSHILKQGNPLRPRAFRPGFAR